MDLSQLRHEFCLQSFDIDDADPCPFRQFESWFQQAISADLVDPNAVVLATVDRDGRPAQRTVLLKYFDTSGLVFFTNYGSRKARHIDQNSHVSLLFQWLPLQRQVEINGTATKISTGESLKYFVTRPHGSRLGAWVSRQSAVVSSRSVLEAKMHEMKQRFASGKVPLPGFWGGYRVVPTHFEFWQGRENRLHDRICYGPDVPQGWNRSRLSP